jgi:hypothetical protein
MYLYGSKKKMDSYWIIFTIDIIKDFPYNYGRIVQMLWKEGNKKKNLYFESAWNDAMWFFKILDHVSSAQAYLN